MSVILLSPIQAPAILDIAKSLTPAGFDLVIANPGTPEFYQAAAEAEYFLGSTRQMGGEFFRSAPKLRLVQLTSAGYDRVDVEAARKAGVLVSNNGGANAIAVAEHTLMLMLAVLKRVVRFHNDVIAGNWRAADSPETRVYELAGRTLGIVGLGNIGKKVARRAAAFDMRVQYYDIARLTLDQEDAIGIRFALFTELLQTFRRGEPARAPRRQHAEDDRRARARPDEADRGPHQHVPGPGHRRGCPVPFAQGKEDRGRRPRRARRRAPRQDAPGLLASQRHAHAPLRRPTWENWTARYRNGFDNIQRVASGARPRWVIPELA
jgi:glyoxylate reductase/D-3-phosphoglycerate dehydrogenase